MYSDQIKYLRSWQRYYEKTAANCSKKISNLEYRKKSEEEKRKRLSLKTI